MASCLDDDSGVVGLRDRGSCFDDSHDNCGNNAAGSLIHGYERWKDELSSSLSAAFCPWQSSQECQPLCGPLDTAQRKQLV